MFPSINTLDTPLESRYTLTGTHWGEWGRGLLTISNTVVTQRIRAWTLDEAQVIKGNVKTVNILVCFT